jgi:hypothetical protein
MFSTKIRTIVVGGHVFTHGNLTEGGVSPCDRINEQLGKWQGAVGDDNDWLNRKASAPPAKPTLKRNSRMPKAKSTAPAAKLSNTTATPSRRRSRRTESPGTPLAAGVRSRPPLFVE